MSSTAGAQAAHIPAATTGYPQARQTLLAIQTFLPRTPTQTRNADTLRNQLPNPFSDRTTLKDSLI
jgi:hypothetical protein